MLATKSAGVEVEVVVTGARSEPKCRFRVDGGVAVDAVEGRAEKTGTILHEAVVNQVRTAGQAVQSVQVDMLDYGLDDAVVSHR